MEKTQNQAHFSKFYIQNVGSNLYGKNEKTASTEIDFIQKRRKILPNHDQCFKDESPIFSMSINTYVPKGLGSFEIFHFKYGQNCVFLPIHRQFYQSENTKCRIFELNQLIRCQIQEKR
jgi:hypothetical protein